MSIALGKTARPPGALPYAQGRLTAEQCRRARIILGWTDQQLADRALCSRVNVWNLEAGIFRSHPTILDAVRGALEEAGIEFLADQGGVPGVRLRESRSH